MLFGWQWFPAWWISLNKKQHKTLRLTQWSSAGRVNLCDFASPVAVGSPLFLTHSLKSTTVAGQHPSLSDCSESQDWGWRQHPKYISTPTPGDNAPLPIYQSTQVSMSVQRCRTSPVENMQEGLGWELNPSPSHCASLEQDDSLQLPVAARTKGKASWKRSQNKQDSRQKRDI